MPSHIVHKNNNNMGIELNEGQITPFTLLLAINNASLAIHQCKWQQLDLLKQCQMLQADKIDTKANRKSLIDELIQDSNHFNDLQTKPYLRIRIKSVISKFHHQSLQLSTSQNISTWNNNQLILSFISYLISIANNNEHKKAAQHPKVWQFVDHLRRYFHDEQYDGAKFLALFNDSKKKPKGASNKGFGLTMMRTVCDKYGLKSGPYSKVKKQCNLWATKLHQQSQGIAVFDDGLNQHKYISTVSQLANKQNNHKNHAIYPSKDDVDSHPMPSSDASSAGAGKKGTYVTKANADDVLHGTCWYWLCDYNKNWKWIPYREKDVKLLNAAWRKKEKQAVIMDGRYRVEFDHTNGDQPCGNQFCHTIANPNGRSVQCFKPQSTVFGMPVDKNPM